MAEEIPQPLPPSLQVNMDVLKIARAPIRPRAFTLGEIQGAVPLLDAADTVREALYGGDLSQKNKVELYKSVIRGGSVYLDGRILPEGKDEVLSKYLKPLQDNQAKEPKQREIQIGGDGERDRLNFSEKPMSVILNGSGTVQWNLGDGVAPDGTYKRRTMQILLEDDFPKGENLTVTDEKDNSRSIEVLPGNNQSKDMKLDVDPHRSTGAANTLSQIGMYILDGLAVEHATTQDVKRRQNIEKVFALVKVTIPEPTPVQPQPQEK